MKFIIEFNVETPNDLKESLDMLVKHIEKTNGIFKAYSKHDNGLIGFTPGETDLPITILVKGSG